MSQALDLPLHEAITKSRVINSGWNFMLIICTSCEWCHKNELKVCARAYARACARRVCVEGRGEFCIRP